MTDTAARVWSDALAAATLLAIDPAGLGGACLRAPAGTVRDAWLAHLRAAIPAGTMRRMPANIGDTPLLGGLDLSATLRAGRPVVARGLLAEADGGIVLLAMAERLSTATAAKLVATLDSGEVRTARDGIELCHPARVGMVALDEGIDADEAPPPALLDRLAFHLNLSDLPPRAAIQGVPADILSAQMLLPDVAVSDDVLGALAATAEALGVASLRALLLAVRAAAAAAALAGRDAAIEADAILAGRLVLVPRATRLPEAPPAEPQAEQQDTPPPPPDAGETEEQPDPGEMADQVLAAIAASLPAGLLAQLRAEAAGRAAGKAAGRAGDLRQGTRRGRPAGVRRGVPRDGQRLNVIETLRAAAPWQRLREKPPGRIAVRQDDFRITHTKMHTETTTIFVVDASGSQALNRLAEAKGAVERLLADCYVRRDRVAVLGFRGKGAELLLPPTRSLVRAKRSLAGLPGGGGTPVAAGIDAAATLVDGLRRRGDTVTIVFLTDGQANVGRDGIGGRAHAEADAHAAGRRLAAMKCATLLIDTSPRPRPVARTLAGAMGAQYLALPQADPALLSRAVQAAAKAAA